MCKTGIFIWILGELVEVSEDESGDEDDDDEEGNAEDEEAYAQEQNAKLEQEKAAILSNHTMIQGVGVQTH